MQGPFEAGNAHIHKLGRGEKKSEKGEVGEKIRGGHHTFLFASLFEFCLSSFLIFSVPARHHQIATPSHYPRLQTDARKWSVVNCKKAAHRLRLRLSASISRLQNCAAHQKFGTWGEGGVKGGSDRGVRKDEIQAAGGKERKSPSAILIFDSSSRASFSSCVFTSRLLFLLSL